ncbi:MAG: hypothetical protein JJ939_11130 [Alphaproteobacteria bacterium]|nr:hypothetical protein [Alphaproteobacteria bacterium]MBO6628968.1 hypothetical protein [Alphaproteobacteria bacterium]MDF1624799.1 hypothetical protein [Parvibaculaceae bacterium]|tara:strand:- start:1573 stop:2067 length:495 start_codon:yes stop_codon:yes gene_type:complete
MALRDKIKPGGGMPNMLNSSLLMFIFVAGIWIAYSTGAINFEEDAAVKVTAEPGAQTGETIPLNVTVQLINNTDSLMELTAPSPCKVFKWVLVDSRRDFVQAKREEMCPQVLMQATLEGNHNTTENFVLEIDPKRLSPNSSYELRVSYWNIEAQTKVDFAISPN